MTLYCPRGYGPDSPFLPPFNGEMTWTDDNTCSYCGSIHPDEVFKAIDNGAMITPTDKNYKIYVDGIKPVGKFYFQHFNDEQAEKFCQLLNDEKINIAVPGWFYVRPFFMGYYGNKFFTKLSETQEIRDFFNGSSSR